MQLMVSDNSVAARLKMSLLVAILPLIAVIHAIGYDWGATDETEQLTRDAGVAAFAAAVVVTAFALYAHFKSTTVGEPVAVNGAIGAMIGTTGTLFLAFDWVQESIVVSVLALVTVVAAIWGVTVTRTTVTPMSRVQTYKDLEPQDHFHGEKGGSEVGWVQAIGIVGIAIGVLIIAID